MHNSSIRNVLILFRREFASYFATPLALVFIVIFLVVALALTFFFGGFYESQQADLNSFFYFHPWLYLFLMPALSMRLWAEERKSGTIELLMTLPIAPWQAVVGKYLAAWAVAGLALALTFPIWITVNYLGDPDNGVILAAYFGSFFVAGGMLAIGACISAVTRNQVIAFILSAVVCFLFLLSGFSIVLEFLPSWLPQPILDAVASLSFWTHFVSIRKGVIDLRDLLYFASVAAAWLAANAIVLDMKKAD
jgi:ABC-2 type transport system permease protein